MGLSERRGQRPVASYQRYTSHKEQQSEPSDPAVQEVIVNDREVRKPDAEPTFGETWA